MQSKVSMYKYKVINSKSAYCIIIDKSLIIEYYKGNFNIDELISIKKIIHQDAYYNPNFNVIQNISDAIFQFQLNEINKLVDLSFKVPNIQNRRSCMLTSTPNQVAMALGYDMLKKDLPVMIHVCSTYEVAFQFIGIVKNDRPLIKQYFNELKSQLNKKT